ncbi:hypothetical protein TanjilG_22523 [Lupinus angustifolius]|uniref:Uncharacterized protein n=1 Tax=Lupinus angustifolius TaxID=3871 RepID=A0A4P1RSY8_LUPAN|nr:PREDICTED: uncharacterized protein LOC109325694 [Lupinus angustifolius]OIW17411.1 hypothetical protein TanjilG_22523 [Lupinus angustifolius]
MGLTKKKQRSKRKNKATTTLQEKKPNVLEATPSGDNNVGLDKDSDTVQIPRAIKTKQSKIENGQKRTSVENENGTTTKSNNEEDNEEVDNDEEQDVDISWPDLFALQLLSQVNEQEKISEQEIPMLPNPLHKELLMDWIDIKHFDIETAKHPAISTNVGPSHKPIGSTRLRPSTSEFGASSQRGMKRALQKVESPPIRAQHFNAATHAPLTTPAPKRLASPAFPSKHAPQIAPRRFSKS